MTTPMERSASMTELRAMVLMDENNCPNTTAAYIVHTSQVIGFLNMFKGHWIPILLHDVTDIDYSEGN